MTDEQGIRVPTSPPESRSPLFPRGMLQGKLGSEESFWPAWSECFAVGATVTLQCPSSKGSVLVTSYTARCTMRASAATGEALRAPAFDPIPAGASRELVSGICAGKAGCSQSQTFQLGVAAGPPLPR